MKQHHQEAIGYAAVASALTASMLPNSPLGAGGQLLAAGAQTALGAAAWLVPAYLADEAVSAWRARQNRAARRLRWAAWVIFTSVAMGLGSCGGRIGELLASSLERAIGFGVYLLVLGAGVLLARNLIGRERVDRAAVVAVAHVTSAWDRTSSRLAAERTALRLAARTVESDDDDDDYITVVPVESVRSVPPPIRARVVDAFVEDEVSHRAVAANAPIEPRQDYHEATDYQLPPVELLAAPTRRATTRETSQMIAVADQISRKLLAHKVECTVRHSMRGPVVDLYELALRGNTTVADVHKRADDLQMLYQGARVVAMPGTGHVGLEVPLPSEQRATIAMREVLDHRAWRQTNAALPVVLGLSATDEPVIIDLATAPHLLVAGTTGAGKSVGLHVMIASMLMRHTPRDLRLILLDPKIVELTQYNGIPHLLAPPATENADALRLLQWACEEMDRRYELITKAKVRNIARYNESSGDHLPRIVIVVEEFADYAMSKECDAFEKPIARLAQKARAAGIHVIVATQRPSVDVISGLIKANFPSRIAYKVVQREDSKTIIGRTGAEHLLGGGDALCNVPALSLDLVRVHGPLITDTEMDNLCKWWRSQAVTPTVQSTPALADVSTPAPTVSTPALEPESFVDPDYERALAYAKAQSVVSLRKLKAELHLGTERAGELIARMKEEGLLEAGPNNTMRLKQSN